MITKFNLARRWDPKSRILPRERVEQARISMKVYTTFP